MPSSRARSSMAWRLACPCPPEPPNTGAKPAAAGACWPSARCTGCNTEPPQKQVQGNAVNRNSTISAENHTATQACRSRQKTLGPPRRRGTSARQPRAPPPQEQSGQHHDDCPARSQFQQPTAGISEWPPAVQAAAPTDRPGRAFQAAQQHAAVWVHKGGHFESIFASEHDLRTARGVARHQDRADCAICMKGARGIHLRVECCLGFANLHETQAGMPLVHPLFRPQVQRAGQRLPQHERDDEHGCKEMPSPGAAAKVTACGCVLIRQGAHGGQNRNLRPTCTERGAPGWSRAAVGAARSRTLRAPT